MKTEYRKLRMEEGRGGSDESPMYIGRSEGCENVQSPKSKVQNHEVAGVVDGAKYEDLPLKTKFSSQDR